MEYLTISQDNLPVYLVMKKIVDILAPRYGEGEGKAMARIIFENIKGWSPVDIAVKSNESVSSFTLSKVNDALRSIMDNEPIQ